jgi:hypothetical protein
MDPTLEQMARLLAESGDYRVASRLESRAEYHPPDDTPKLVAAVVDVETTGTAGESLYAPVCAGMGEARTGTKPWQSTIECHERTDERRCDAVQEMRVGPSEPAVRSRLQTTASCDGYPTTIELAMTQEAIWLHDARG